MPLNTEELNPEQRSVVEHCEGPLLVLAGAGSGKTRALTYRIAHLVKDLDVAPWHILAITFTNKAAQEMRERLSLLLGDDCTDGMWVCTFHALCVRLLRSGAEYIGRSSSFSIYDDDDSKRLVKSICKDLNIDEKLMATARNQISTAKNNLIGADEFRALACGPIQKKIADIYDELQIRLERSNAFDFDDLLFCAWKLLRDNPDELLRRQERFRYIHVDEYQDTNKAQYEIVALLANKYHNIMVVGDDDQSIYSWRGADIRNILEFEKDFRDAFVVKLEQNYRSDAIILRAANALIQNNKNRKSKELFTCRHDGERVRVCCKVDEVAEATYIAGEIKALHDRGVAFDSIAVFYRTNAQSRALEDGLLRAGLSYQVIGGTRFYDREEIRDLMGYLKLALNPADDVAARRVINKPARGIGAATQAKIADLANSKRICFVDAALDFVCDGSDVAPRTRNAVTSFLAILDSIRHFEGDLGDVVEMIAETGNLISSLQSEGTDEAADRLENIKEFIGVAQDYEQSHASEGQVSLSDFMEWLALRTDLDSLDDEQDCIRLMTVHAAKGLEFDTVFVAGMEDGIFPHTSKILDSSDELEEERRLAYVAITRARRRLYLCYVQKRRLWGDVLYNPRSRFIDEIPAELCRAVGLGSDGFAGIGHDRRGSRHGIAGAGHDTQAYGGRVFGASTPSSGRTLRAEVQTSSAPHYASASNQVSFEAGDQVNHKKFGVGRVLSVKGDTLVVEFDSCGAKTLLKGYAPLVKLT